VSGQLAALLLALIVFSVVHSLLATTRARDASARWGLGARADRLLYNVISIVLFIPAWALVRGGFPVVWKAEGSLRVLLLGVQAASLVGFVIALRSFDIGEFLGFRAPREAGDGPERTGARPRAAPVLNTHGAYALCRHPLYFFIGLFFSVWPVMDAGRLAFAVWVWLYAWVGSIFEERRLVAKFGAAYRAYQKTHWRLLPFGPRSRSQTG